MMFYRYFIFLFVFWVWFSDLSLVDLALKSFVQARLCGSESVRTHREERGKIEKYEKSFVFGSNPQLLVSFFPTEREVLRYEREMGCK